MAPRPRMLLMLVPFLAACGASTADLEGFEDAAESSMGLTIPAGNLVANPSFETNADGWTGWRSMFERVARPTSAPHGQYVLWVGRVTGAEYSIDDAAPTIRQSVPGTTYVASAAVRASGNADGKPLTLVLRETDAAGRVRHHSSSPVLLRRSFQLVSVEATTTLTGSVDVYAFQSRATSGDGFYIDAITVSAKSDTPTQPEAPTAPQEPSTPQPPAVDSETPAAPPAATGCGSDPAPPQGGGKTYFVSPNGNDNNNGTTAPFRTLQRAANVMAAGDTIVVEDGTYAPPSFSRAGTATNLIWFKARNKWGAKIQSFGPSGVSFNGSAAFIRFEGFDISGMRRNQDSGSAEAILVYGSTSA